MNVQSFTRAQYREASSAILAHTLHRPRVGLILGSGLNSLADEVEHADHIDYGQIPHFPQPSVAGHSGRLVIGRLTGQDVLIMQGRAHAYEGLSQAQVTLPVRVMYEMGIRTLIVTNGAGGLNPAYRPGDLMLIVDHIGLAALTGANPLWGPNDDSYGPRFPDLSKAYTPALRRLAVKVAHDLAIPLQQGVYVGLTGPTYETPAEVRFLRSIGGDATGMSTVAEVIVAVHMGMQVLGISGITNAAIDDPDSERVTTHEEVLEAGRVMVPKLIALLRGVLAEISRE